MSLKLRLAAWLYLTHMTSPPIYLVNVWISDLSSLLFNDSKVYVASSTAGRVILSNLNLCSYIMATQVWLRINSFSLWGNSYVLHQ